MLGFDKGTGPCFQFQLKRCDGACAGQESASEHNARLLSVLDSDRIAAWPFTGPLALGETNIRPWEGQPSNQYHIVDHWSYLGSVENLNASQPLLQSEGARFFDRDAYRLLISAMSKGRVEIYDATTGEPLDNPFLVTGPRE